MISRYLRRACCGEKKPYLADPSNTQDTCHMNLASDGFAQHWVWLGGRASERPIQSSEIPFFTGTQNHSWYNTRDMTIKHLSATLLRPSRSISFWRKNIKYFKFACKPVYCSVRHQERFLLRTRLYIPVRHKENGGSNDIKLHVIC